MASSNSNSPKPSTSRSPRGPTPPSAPSKKKVTPTKMNEFGDVFTVSSGALILPPTPLFNRQVGEALALASTNEVRALYAQESARLERLAAGDGNCPPGGLECSMRLGGVEKLY